MYYGWSAVILPTKRPAYAGAGDVLLVTSLVAWTLLDLTRGVYIGLYAPPVTTSLPSHPLITTYTIVVMVLVLMIALGRIMMNLQRLEYDFHVAQQRLEEDIIRRQKYETELEGFRQHLEKLVAERTRALSLSESKFRALVEQSLVGIYIYQDRFFRYANKALCQMLGYATAEAFVDRVPGIELVIPQDRFSVLKCIVRISRGLGEESTFAIGLLRQDGKTVDVEVRSRTIAVGGQPAAIGVVIDVSERNRATEGLRALASSLQFVREKERTRIARDLHDDLGQAMTALKMKALWLKKQLPPETVEENLAGIDEMEQMINQIAQSVHNISWALRPGVLDTLGLVAAIEWLGKDFQRNAGIRCQLDLPQKSMDIDPGHATHLFRICQKLRLVIADDHGIVRQGIRMIIESEEDMEVVGEAAWAYEALAIITAQKPDIAILDINLPDQNGFDLLQDIRRELPHLPVLFLTIHPEEIFAVRAMQAGAQGYLCKDSSSDELVKALRKIASGGIYVTASLAEILARGINKWRTIRNLPVTRSKKNQLI